MHFTLFLFHPSEGQFTKSYVCIRIQDYFSHTAIQVFQCIGKSVLSHTLMHLLPKMVYVSIVSSPTKFEVPPLEITNCPERDHCNIATHISRDINRLRGSEILLYTAGFNAQNGGLIFWLTLQDTKFGEH